MKNCLLVFFPFLLISCGLSGRQPEKTVTAYPEIVPQENPVAENGGRDTVDFFGKDRYPDLHPEEEESDGDLTEEFENISNMMSEYPELAEWKPLVNPYNGLLFFASGNFFGDRDDDVALLVRHISMDNGEKPHKVSTVKLCVVHKGNYGLRFVGLEDHTGGDYSWVGEFRTVPAGEPLWSNYEDDFRSFEEIPEDEVVYLNYDALFVHAMGACGGGFIFWKDGEFHWLQQE